MHTCIWFPYPMRTFIFHFKYLSYIVRYSPASHMYVFLQIATSSTFSNRVTNSSGWSTKLVENIGSKAHKSLHTPYLYTAIILSPASFPCPNVSSAHQPRGCTHNSLLYSQRVHSPSLPFEELARILADQWANLSDEAKTPYKNKAAEECRLQEALGAAVALTQVRMYALIILFVCGVVYYINY